MEIKRLEGARNYFNEVLKPNFDEFMGTPSSFRTAFNLVSALLHMHEWVFAYDKAAAETYFRAQFARPWPLWEHIEKVQPKAKFIRDVANASKHVVIDRNPSTSMSHQANTSIQTAGFGEGGYGVGRYSAPSVMMSEGAGEVSLDDCARAVFDVWDTFIKSLPAKT